MRRALLAITLLSAAAAPASAATAWLCNLSEDAVRLVCVADPDPRDEAAKPAAPTASVRGTQFPLNPGLVYSVDLWSPPSEPESLELLARATICYRSPGCSVTMAPVQWSVRQRSLAQR